MPQKIVIEGGIARVVNEQVVAEAPLEQLAPFLETRLATVLPILPDHTRLVAFDPNTKKGILIIETVPFRQHITCHAERGDYNFTGEDLNRIAQFPDRRAVWNLQFPYQYHVYTFATDTGPTGQGLQNFQLNEGKLYWRPQKFTSLEDKFWTAQLFNIDTNGRICWGYTQAETASLAQRVDDQVKSFQATIFNTHLGAKKPHTYQTYVEWETASNNPLCYLEWSNFKQPTNLTAKALIDSLGAKDMPIADTSKTTDAIPQPPDVFTVGKALDWFKGISPQQRKLFTVALARTMKEDQILNEELFTVATAAGETAGKAPANG